MKYGFLNVLVCHLGQDRIIAKAWKMQWTDDVWIPLSQMIHDFKVRKTDKALPFDHWKILQHSLLMACHNVCDNASAVAVAVFTQRRAATTSRFILCLSRRLKVTPNFFKNRFLFLVSSCSSRSFSFINNAFTYVSTLVVIRAYAPTGRVANSFTGSLDIT